MKFRIIEGPLKGQIIDIPDSGMLIGRDDVCHLQLDGEKMSRRHARLTNEAYGYSVEDLGSTNGVYVNGQRIEGRKSLMNGDKIRFGDHLMLFTDERDILAEDELARRTTVTHAGDGSGGMRAILVALAITLSLLLIGLLTWQILQPPVATQPPVDLADDSPTDTPRYGIDDAPISLPPVATQPPSSSSQPSDGSATSTSGQPGPGPGDGTGTADAPTRHFWIQTEPPGALASIDGRRIGLTPCLALDLADGAHTLRLESPGHVPLERQILIPLAGDFPVYQLEVEPRSVLITSEPAHASVFMGTQWLGQTPYLLREWPVGRYELRLGGTGLQTTPVEVEIVDYRGSHVHTVLPSLTGTLEIVTLPPGASVFIDGVAAGETQPGPQRDAASAPLLVPKLLPGNHVVTINYQGLHSAEYRVALQPKATARVQPTIWLPNIRLTTDDNRTLSGMLIERGADGSITLAPAPNKQLTLPADKIRDRTIRSFKDAFEAGGDWPAN